MSNFPDVGTKLRAVTKSDTTVVACQGLYIGGTGDVAIQARDDSAAVTLSTVPAGTVLPIDCYRVFSTGTTATNIVAIYL